MSAERQLAPVSLAADPSAGSFESERAQVLALVSALRQAPTLQERAIAVEALRARVASLPGRWPGENVQPLLQLLLDDGDLGRLLDAQGDALRRTFVAANQALGFPWALELDPADLKHLGLRPPRGQPGTVMAMLAAVSATVACCWTGLLLIGIGASMQLRAGDLFGLTFVFAGFAHALVALVTLVRASPQRRASARRTLRGLTWGLALGPAAATLLAATDANEWPELFALGLIFAAPSMLTAGFCGLTAWRLAPGPGEPPDATQSP